MAKKKPFNLDLAISLYQNQRLAASQIAKQFGVHLQTVINRFKEAKVLLRPQGQIPNTLDPNVIKYDYETGQMSTTKIAEKYSISTSLVRKKLKECGIRVKRSGGSFKAIKIDTDKLIQLYCNDMLTLRACARRFRVSDSVIRRYLRQLNIPIRPSTRGFLTDVDDNQIIDLYWNQKFSISKTAKITGKSANLIRGRLEKSGRGTRSISEGARLWRGSDDVPDDQLIYLYDVCGWSCEKISAHFGRSVPFTRHRFMAIGKARRKNIGKNTGAWKGGVTDIRNAVRSCASSLQWRKDAFGRQQYKSEISGRQIRELNCHHICPFHVILQSSITKHKPLPDEYRSLAIMNDPRFYDDDNSLVVSKGEHDKIEEGKLEQAHPWWKIWQAYPDFATKRSGITSDEFKLFNQNGQIEPVNYVVQSSTAKEIRRTIRYEHYLGTLPGSKLILVAKISNIIIGIATFGTGTNKYIKDNTWELTRLCIPFYVVRPFACDFLSQCCNYIKNHHPHIEGLIAFADSSVGHNGAVYRMAGWTKAGRTSSSYAYFDPTTLQLKHKAACRRIKGLDKTEKELATERGWIRIPLTHKHRYIFGM